MPESYLSDTSHKRYNLLRGSWTLVSPHRIKRPWQGQQEGASDEVIPEYDDSCYLCPGNSRANGSVNPDYNNIFVFENDYSAVKNRRESGVGPNEDPAAGSSDDLLRAEIVTGTCYVITFSRMHNITFSDMNGADILDVVEAWTYLYCLHLPPYSPTVQSTPEKTPFPLSSEQDISAITHQYRYMQIFENKGAAMGCSNPHPHGQIWVLSSLPDEPALELMHLANYQKDKEGANLLVDYARKEIKSQERVVYENDTFLTLCPWWAVWPYEVMIVSKEHRRSLADLNKLERENLAESIMDITRRYDNIFKTRFPYSMGVHQAPLDGTEEEIMASHLHIHFYPPLLRSANVKKFLVGYEMLAEPQRDITPEAAAIRLRECGGPLYRKSRN